jgi:hypothetical protein
MQRVIKNCGIDNIKIMQHVVQLPVNPMLFMELADVQWQYTGNFEDVCSVIWSSWAKHVFSIPVHSRLVKVSGEGVIRVLQHVRKWCKEFESGKMDIRDEHTDQHSTLSACVNAAQVEEVILGNQRVTCKLASSIVLGRGSGCSCVVTNASVLILL